MKIFWLSQEIFTVDYLTVRKESFHPEMQFKGIFVGGRGRIFEKKQVEVKNIRGSEKTFFYKNHNFSFEPHDS